MLWPLLLTDASHFEVPELDPEGDASVLAARIATRCGNPYILAEIAFTYVVETGGVEQIRRRHIWHPREGTVEVIWEGGSVFLESLHPFVASPDPKDQAIQAFSWFVSDSYWLLAPCKVMDPGVTPGVTTDGSLHLQFTPNTGLTSGDQYWLTADEEGVIRSWMYLREDGGHGHFAWDPPQRYGPLELSVRRVSAGGDVVIRFEEIIVQ